MRTRLDKLVLERGLAPTREKAQALILAGQIHINGRRADKAGMPVPADARVELVGEAPRYVGRGGIKLEGALEDFGLDPTGKICLDIGSSTGGFTDCLLQHGAARVYAVDVGKGQLDWKLRQDARVAVREGINARHLKPEEIGEPVDWVTLDVAFISVAKILPAALACARPGATFLILVKPQFEVGKGRVGKGGVVRDPALHREVISDISAWLEGVGNYDILGVTESPITGPKGNIEFLIAVRKA